MTVEFTVPIRIESELNCRDHWATRKRRKDKQREAVYWGYRGAIPQSGTLLSKCPFPAYARLVVTLTRIAPRRITDEHDNLRSGWKGVVDLLAELLNADDGDGRIQWRYEQEKGRPKEYAARVRIESAPFTTERTAGRMS